MFKNVKFLFYIQILIFIISCTQQQEKQKNQIETNKLPKVINMKLTSLAFGNNGAIPSEFTCDGADISPSLTISEVPNNAKSLALIMDDPDAPVETFVHWVVWNIPPNSKEIKRGAEPDGMQGKTDFRKLGYGGPCPPSGTHRYFFKLYALDTTLNLPQGSTKKDLERAMQGHIIEKTQLIGMYRRKH